MTPNEQKGIKNLNSYEFFSRFISGLRITDQNNTPENIDLAHPQNEYRIHQSCGSHSREDEIIISKMAKFRIPFETSV